MKIRLRAGVVTFLVAMVGLAGLAAAQQPTATMRDLFGALAGLLPYSMTAERWTSPANAAAIEEHLARLAAHASAIQHHGLGLNESYGRARDALAADAREALVAYRTGETTIARYVVRNLTEDCFACHSRLPAYSVAELGETATDLADLSGLNLDEHLRLLVATRQFDAALDLSEQLLRSRDVSASELDLMGVFENYLKVAIRVNRDFKRPERALWEFLQRDDVPLYLADLTGEWIASLDTLGRGKLPPDLSLATDLLREANNRNEFVRDRRGMVHAIVASSLLHQFVQTNPEDPVALAEAYYRLGVAEAAISRTIWVPETEYFLERAIRAAPDSPYAMHAYTFLEQYVLASYTGSAGTAIPDDAWDRLAELRALVEAQGSERDH